MKKVVGIILTISLFAMPFFARAATLKSTYPRLANYFLKWEISDQEAQELAKWDLLVLDMETQENSPEQLRKIRELNPDIIILAYLTSQEIYNNINNFNTLSLRQRLASRIIDDWWLRDSQGQKVSNWSNTSMINLSATSPLDSLGQRFIDYLPEFVNTEIQASGFWDGVFYDNTWGDVSWLNNGDLDLDGDGKKDDKNMADELWSAGFKKMLEKTRRLTGDDFIIVGNGRVYDGYQGILNGMMLEDFPSSWENGGTWTGSMETYLKIPALNHSPNVSIINVFAKNQNNYRAFRFGLVSTLLGDGFYSFDYDITDHGQTWWYDEYDVNLGPAESKAYNVLKKNSNYLEPGLWRRDFKNASVFVNSTDKDRGYIFSKEEMERINGQQDTAFNNGESLNYLRLSPQEGIVLLKKNSAIMNKAFSNGYFFRVFNSRGEQLRNGFFSYFNNYPGGEEIIIAAGSNYQYENVSLVSNHGEVELYKNSEKLVGFNPYNNLFHGDLSLAAEVDDGYIKRVVVSPKNSGGPQVLVFTLDGKIRANFFAYDKSLRGGLHVALGDVDGDGEDEIVTGPGRGEKPLIKIFSFNGTLKNEFLAYGEGFRGGVDVSVADVTGDGHQDIITAPGAGGGPHVRVFNYDGVPRASFFAYDKDFHGGIEISTSDLNEDGRADILVGIKDFY